MVILWQVLNLNYKIEREEKQIMKIFLVPMLAILFLLCTISTSFGDSFYRTYEVLAKSDNSLTLVDSEGYGVKVNKDPKDYKVGYKVRYDSVRDILKKNHWQDYTVRKVSSSSITLKHKTGDSLTLKSGEVKTHFNKFKKGDAVSYDEVNKHIKLT
jgi:hypothetical protein